MDEKELKNLEAELGMDGLSVARGSEAETAALSFARNQRATVWMREIMEDPEFLQQVGSMKLPFILEIGELLVDSLERVKHLLVAGTTGSGKSFFLNALILLLMMLRKPSDVRLFLIDPKRVEFSMFKGSPHVAELETNPLKAIDLLHRLTAEMDKRYTVFEEMGVRNIDSYNKLALTPIPRIVVVIDEFADLMMLDPSVEEPVVRLGQLARASGIHLVLATQRPSVDVVTGLIKTNLPSRVVFACSGSNDY